MCSCLGLWIGFGDVISRRSGSIPRFSILRHKEYGIGMDEG